MSKFDELVKAVEALTDEVKALRMQQTFPVPYPYPLPIYQPVYIEPPQPFQQSFYSLPSTCGGSITYTSNLPNTHG